MLNPNKVIFSTAVGPAQHFRAQSDLSSEPTLVNSFKTWWNRMSYSAGPTKLIPSSWKKHPGKWQSWSKLCRKPACLSPERRQPPWMQEMDSCTGKPKNDIANIAMWFCDFMTCLFWGDGESYEVWRCQWHIGANHSQTSNWHGQPFSNTSRGRVTWADAECHWRLSWRKRRFSRWMQLKWKLFQEVTKNTRR